MPRWYFDLFQAGDLLLDPEGIEIAIWPKCGSARSPSRATSSPPMRQAVRSISTHACALPTNTARRCSKSGLPMRSPSCPARYRQGNGPADAHAPRQFLA